MGMCGRRGGGCYPPEMRLSSRRSGAYVHLKHGARAGVSRLEPSPEQR